MEAKQLGDLGQKVIGWGALNSARFVCKNTVGQSVGCYFGSKFTPPLNSECYAKKGFLNYPPLNARIEPLNIKRKAYVSCWSLVFNVFEAIKIMRNSEKKLFQRLKGGGL